MRKISLLSLGLLFSVLVTAQTVHVNVTRIESEFVNDSLFILMSLSGDVENLNARDAILLTPTLSSAEENAKLSSIQLNGKYKQILHQRSNEIMSKMKNGLPHSNTLVQPLGSDGKFDIVGYKASIAKADWMEGADLQIKCENLNASNEVTALSTLFVEKVESSSPMGVIKPVKRTERVVAESGSRSSDQVVAQKPVRQSNYKGTYLAPEADAMDERNQRDLNFSLSEAQVMVNVNPEILSLKELFTVAMSYKEDREKFYNIISISVKLFPTNPIANLNAAAMAVELGNVEAAKKYLQIAPYESLAYKNCRGAYELMNGNIYEGIRLLKSAKSEGSEEAAYNLDLFFKTNK